MTKRVEENIIVENARIIFKNFSGEETEYNAKGQRNFSLVLDKEMADKLSADGWNVKCKLPRNEEEDELCHLPVSVGMDKGYPPNVVLITSRGRTTLDEDSIDILDGLRAENIDLVIRPYNWEMKSGATGVKAYLKSIFFTVEEDDLDRKYAGVPDAARAGLEED